MKLESDILRRLRHINNRDIKCRTLTETVHPYPDLNTQNSLNSRL